MGDAARGPVFVRRRGERMTGPLAPTDWDAMMGDVAIALLGKPNAALSSEHELRYRRRGSLAVHIAGPYAGRFRDHEAGTGGGVLDLVQRERGGNQCEAWAWLRAHGFLSGRSVPAQERGPRAVTTRGADDRETRDKRARAYQLWEEARPLRGSLAEAYLHGRGVEVGSTRALRFHPRLWHPVERCSFPCLVACVQDAAGRFLAIQRTYLQGPHKAPVQPARANLGRLTGGAVRLAEPANGVLLVGEGIESTAAAMQRLDLPGWAALGTPGLRVLVLPEAIREGGRSLLTVTHPDSKRRRRSQNGWRPRGGASRSLRPVPAVTSPTGGMVDERVKEGCPHAEPA